MQEGEEKNRQALYTGRFLIERRVRDSNPRRLSPQQFSRLPQSTALPTLRRKNTFADYSSQILNKKKKEGRLKQPPTKSFSEKLFYCFVSDSSILSTTTTKSVKLTVIGIAPNCTTAFLPRSSFTTPTWRFFIIFTFTPGFISPPTS